MKHKFYHQAQTDKNFGFVLGKPVLSDSSKGGRIAGGLIVVPACSCLSCILLKNGHYQCIELKTGVVIKIIEQFIYNGNTKVKGVIKIVLSL